MSSLLSPQVEFCGYSIPHPAEAKMHVRIQTYGIVTHLYYEGQFVRLISLLDNTDPRDVLDKALDDLMDVCDVVIEKFEGAQSAYKAKHGHA